MHMSMLPWGAGGEASLHGACAVAAACIMTHKTPVRLHVGMLELPKFRV
jgi:hypothetical protein